MCQLYLPGWGGWVGGAGWVYSDNRASLSSIWLVLNLTELSLAIWLLICFQRLDFSDWEIFESEFYLSLSKCIAILIGQCLHFNYNFPSPNYWLPGLVWSVVLQKLLTNWSKVPLFLNNVIVRTLYCSENFRMKRVLMIFYFHNILNKYFTYCKTSYKGLVIQSIIGQYLNWKCLRKELIRFFCG